MAMALLFVLPHRGTHRLWSNRKGVLHLSAFSFGQEWITLTEKNRAKFYRVET